MRRRPSALPLGVALLLLCGPMGPRAAGDEPAPPAPAAPESPSGLVPRLSLRNELLVVPRLVLALPRLLFQGLTYPARVILYAYDHAINALTSEDGLVGVRLAFDTASNTRMLLGLSFFDDRIVGRRTGLYVKIATGGPQLVVADVVFEPVPAERPVRVQIEAAYRMRDDQMFRAIPSLSAVSPDRGQSRFSISAADLWVRPKLRLSRVVTLTAETQLGYRSFGDGRADIDNPPITTVYCVRSFTGRCVAPGIVDEQQVPGFTEGTLFLRTGATLLVDAVDRPGRPSRGVRFVISAHYTHGLTDPSSYAQLAGVLDVPINLWQRSHILLLRVRTELIFPIAGSMVPFSELATLGGADTLRGFVGGRFRDNSSLILTAEYRWPIWIYADAFLFADWGGVAGLGFADLTIHKLYPDVGAGIRLRNSRSVALRLQIGYGFPDGFQFSLAIGSGA